MNYKVYEKTEVEEKSLEYFNGEELSSKVWIDKYCLKNNDGELLETTPLDTHKRMAKEFARIEGEYFKEKISDNDFKNLSKFRQKNRELLSEEKIMEYFDNFKYIIPQGSVMASLGNEFNYSSLSNCVVVPEIYDSYGGIAYTNQQLAQLFKRRCGVGTDISTLRPRHSTTNNSAGTSTGAISFMERFSNTTREVAQDGRRGALMLTLSVQHPDIEEFIEVKRDLTKVTGANISIRISDEFMNAVKNDEEYTLKFPVDSENPTITKVVKAKELWNKIVSAARDNAEPGLIFWDRQHKYSTSSVYPEYKNVSTNPCLTGDAKVITDRGIMTMKEIFESFNELKNIKTMSFNETSKTTEWKTINESMLTRRNANVIELELENGSKLKLTPDHKVYTENRGWIEAAKLNEDDILLYLE